jgi:hypothetical protein
MFASCNTANHIKSLQTLNHSYDSTYENAHYKISKIDSINEVYIIYAEKNDSIFKVVSEKVTGNCNKIKEGFTYALECKSLINGVAGKRHIAGVNFNGTIIRLEGDKVVWDLFYCENLKGLCLIDTQK